MVRFKERKGQKESSDKMKLSNRILVLFCCCVCFICVGSIVAEKATVNAVEYVLSPTFQEIYHLKKSSSPNLV